MGRFCVKFSVCFEKFQNNPLFFIHKKKCTLCSGKCHINTFKVPEMTETCARNIIFIILKKICHKSEVCLQKGPFWMLRASFAGSDARYFYYYSDIENWPKNDRL